MGLRLVCPLALGGAVLLAARHAHPCGASMGGAAGLAACSLKEHKEAMRQNELRAGISGSYTSTSLRFSGGRRADQERWVVLPSFEIRPWPSVTLQVAAGALVGGQIALGGVRYDLSPGFVGALGASWRLIDADGARPFVLVAAQLATLLATSHPATAPSGDSTDYEAFDVRAGATVGWALGGNVAPYALARAFGGPIFWRVDGASVTGTDAYHYQLGAGLSITVGNALDVFVEGVPLGERGASAGAGMTF